MAERRWAIHPFVACKRVADRPDLTPRGIGGGGFGQGRVLGVGEPHDGGPELVQQLELLDWIELTFDSDDARAGAPCCEVEPDRLERAVGRRGRPHSLACAELEPLRGRVRLRQQRAVTVRGSVDDERSLVRHGHVPEPRRSARRVELVGGQHRNSLRLDEIGSRPVRHERNRSGLTRSRAQVRDRHGRG